MDAVELLRKKILPFFEPEFKELTVQTGVCEVFGIEVNGFLNVDSYQTTTIQSDILRIFTHPSLKNIGFAQGTKEKPTQGMRLIDYKGAWLVVPTNNDQPELWCSGNYLKKISDETPFKIRPLAGGAALAALLEDHRSCLVIELSARKELYLQNLIVGDENHLSLCQEEGNIIIPRNNWTTFKDLYLLMDKKTQAEALTVLRAVNTGRFDQKMDRVQKFYKENAEFSMFCAKALPQNPIARNVWFSALGSV